MTRDGNGSADSRNEEGASPLGMGTQSEALAHKGETRTELGGAQARGENRA